MRSLSTIFILLLLSLLSFESFATTYYLSSSSGSDNNSGTDPSSPWRSIDKLNSFYNLRPGDNVLFKRGDTFYGGIVVNNSGSSGNPITYGAYGSGAKPIITGFTTITSWNNLGGNIWESSNAVSSLPYTNMVAVNGVNTAMGRYPNSTGPNTGYLSIQSHSGAYSITAAGGLGSNNWTGAGIVIRKERWALERGTITSQYGNTLNFHDQNQYSPQDGFGFFIQNDPKTLDVNGEWYYNPSNHKLRVYSSSTPNQVKIATVENLFSIDRESFISIDNLNFMGSNSDALHCVSYSSNLSIQNCDISFVGMSGIFSNMTNSIFQNNNIKYTNYLGIMSTGDNCTIKSNYLNSINMFEGMDQESTSGGSIATYGVNTIIQYNQVEKSGYSGIKFGGHNSKISNNLVIGFCYIKEDGGGIDMSARDRASGSIIDHNIVLNGVGSKFGTSDITLSDFGGIFIDAYGTGITISNNTVANCTAAGIKLHGANNITVTNNTTYNNGSESWTKGGLELVSQPDYLIRNLKIEGNIFFAKLPIQLAYFAYPASGNLNDIFSFGDFNNNYYAKPIDPNSAIQINHNIYNVLGWRSFSGKDGGSQSAPKNISDINDLRFEYNATSASKTIQLDANYIDVKNSSYNGSITLAPYTSAVLIRNGEKTSTDNKSPVANVGDDRTIQFPKNSVVLPGSGSDDDGSIVSYSWSQISGPTSATLENASSAQAGAGNLQAGIYQFQLVVTDNKGATGSAVLKVTVLSEGQDGTPTNIPPEVNVGDDREIDLPKNSIVLPGSAMDQDGSIASYSWSQISGPSSATMVNTTSAQAGAGDLQAGVYQFQLKVTDNQGASSTSILKVTVKARESLNISVNISPTANVGDDREIDLPKNSIVLPGSGTDPDGSIVSYSWSQVSGPSSATIINPTSMQAGAGNLEAGTYVFQLKVTDNQGATGTANLKVTVNSDNPNISPIASVGDDREIDLPKNSIVLPGSATDQDGSIVSYSWSQISGPSSATMINTTSAQAGAGDLIAGTYVFKLTVTDNQGAAGTANLKVTVNSENPNIPPVASVGDDREIDLPKNSIVLPGSGTDPDGSIASYSWSQVSGPSSATMINTTSAQAGAGDLIAGTYVFKLTVTDNRGATGTENLKVTVNSENPNISPVASVGDDRKIDLPKNSIVLPGSGIDEDGYIVSYNWSQTSGPNAAYLINPTSAQAGAGNLIEGEYRFQLTVTDNHGATGTAILQVTVGSGTSNISPVANGGSDRSIVLPKNSIVLPGSGSDKDGYVVSYNWSQLSGPNTAYLINSTSAQAGAGNLIAGIYKFQLKVTDNQGATGTDVINVTVSNTQSAQRKMSSDALSSTDEGALQTDFTNKTSIAVTDQTEMKLGVIAYPNPFINSITVRITGPEGAYSLSFVDATGRTLWTKKGKKNNGTYQEVINTSDIGSGIYFLTLIQNNERSTVKLEK